METLVSLKSHLPYYYLFWYGYNQWWQIEPTQLLTFDETLHIPSCQFVLYPKADLPSKKFNFSPLLRIMLVGLNAKIKIFQTKQQDVTQIVETEQNSTYLKEIRLELDTIITDLTLELNSYVSWWQELGLTSHQITDTDLVVTDELFDQTQKLLTDTLVVLQDPALTLEQAWYYDNTNVLDLSSDVGQKLLKYWQYETLIHNLTSIQKVSQINDYDTSNQRHEMINYIKGWVES